MPDATKLPCVLSGPDLRACDYYDLAAAAIWLSASESLPLPHHARLIKADVDRHKRAPDDQPIAWPKAKAASRAVREYLAALDARTSRILEATGLPQRSCT